MREKKIEFSEHKVGEEAIYSFMLVRYAKSFSCIRGSVYKYVNHPGSQSDTADDDPWGGVATALKEKITQMGLYEEYADTINAFLATATIVSIDKMTRKYFGVDFQCKAKKRVQKYRREIDRQFPVDLKHMGKKAKIMYPFLRAGWITPIYVASRVNRARKNKYASLPTVSGKGTNESRTKNQLPIK